MKAGAAWTVEIDGIQVDVEGLLRLRHACDPLLCKTEKCCCRHYEVTFTRREMTRAISLMPQCRTFARHLRAGGDLENPFEPSGDGLYVVDEREDGACAFAFSDATGAMWCSIHAAALKLGLDPWKWKSQVCIIWPLGISEGRPPLLGVQEGVFQFPCNKKPRRRLKHLDPGVSACIARVLGSGFLKQLEDRIEAGPEPKSR
jgi:hypothetical protein